MEKKINLKRIGIIVVVLLFIVLTSYKLAMFLKYKTDNLDINQDGIFNETIEVTYKESDTVTYDEMSYKDYFTDYVEVEEMGFKVKYDADGEVESAYNIIKEPQYISMLSINSFEMAIDEEENKDVDFSTEEDMKKLLKEKNINDDIDLIKYIKDNYYFKNYLFTPTKTMRNNYILNSFAQSAFPNFENIALIKGDKIKGYVMKMSSGKIKVIHLLYKDNQYGILLVGDELNTTEFINSLLETISFD